MTIKLIASDLDATFLRDDKTINEPLFREVLQKMNEQKIQFIVATGNHLQKVLEYFRNFEGQYQIIANNGAEVMLNGQIQNVKVVPTAALKNIVAITEKYLNDIAVGLAFTGQSKTYMLKTQAQIGHTFQEASKYFQNLILIDNLEEIVEPVLKATIVLNRHETLYMNDLKSILGNSVHVTTSGYGAIDIVNSEVNKANALAYIAKALNVDESDIMAFGDGLNDMEMLEYVGHPVAMVNSDPELFKHDFDISVANNQDDGVLRTILKSI
ncbi:haloacid dehalogenase [Leuconostoc litchii]|uniref:HAD family phosphatase n=1 Tax=Leuconostoc litchii TaxID=1981069 RepID=A0A6P2CK08_9LACO|nr:HAD family hydrolase [Leuconostoc litchii]TYC46193.1 HAD family phosphatase [Leuconostoc litchii]GMA70349.1 haloacid dehalogenase [Leuconostoc litchii]